MADSRITFAAIQMSMKTGDKEANLRRAETFIDQAVKTYSPHIIGLPEFFNTEYFPQYMDRKYFDYAEGTNGTSVKRIAEKAKQHDLYVIAPIYEKAARGVYFDSSVLIGPDGKVIGVTRKVETPNIWFKEGGAWSNEDFYYASGNLENAYPVFETKIGKIGQIICWNRHFPEVWRTLAMKGAEIIFVPVASMGKHFSEMFSLEMRVMAYVHQVFTVLVNRVGNEGKAKMYGGSHIVSPRGKILAGPASDKKEEIVVATLDLEELDKARQEIPLMKSFLTSTFRTQLAYNHLAGRHSGLSL